MVENYSSAAGDFTELARQRRTIIGRLTARRDDMRAIRALFFGADGDMTPAAKRWFLMIADRANMGRLTPHADAHAETWAAAQRALVLSILHDVQMSDLTILNLSRKMMELKDE